MAKRSNKSLEKACAFWAIIISAVLFVFGGIFGAISAILNLIGKIALGIAVAFPAWDYATSKGKVWRIIFYIALVVYIGGCIFGFLR